LQNELESSFIYEDDQTKSTAEVSRYGEWPSYGPFSLWGCRFCKTEVAIRAAFKAVDNSKQVAILCLQPFWLTSITALYRAFKRYAGFHRYLNRFRTAKQKQRL
jgi:transcription-repair coupling factor (superfamily II helicase)